MEDSVTCAFLLTKVIVKSECRHPKDVQGGVIVRCWLYLLSFLGFLVLKVIHQLARIVGHGGMGRAAGGHDHVHVGAEGPAAAREGQRE